MIFFIVLINNGAIPNELMQESQCLKDLILSHNNIYGIAFFISILLLLALALSFHHHHYLRLFKYHN